MVCGECESYINISPFVQYSDEFAIIAQTAWRIRILGMEGLVASLLIGRQAEFAANINLIKNADPIDGA